MTPDIPHDDLLRLLKAESALSSQYAENVREKVRKAVIPYTYMSVRKKSWEEISNKYNISISCITLDNNGINIKGVWKFQLNDQKIIKPMQQWGTWIIPSKKVWEKLIKFMSEWDIEDKIEFLEKVMNMHEMHYWSETLFYETVTNDDGEEESRETDMYHSFLILRWTSLNWFKNIWMVLNILSRDCTFRLMAE